MRFVAAVAAVGLLALAGPAAAQSHDHDGGRDPATGPMLPIAELQRSIDATPDGGTVRLVPGTIYHGDLVISRSVDLVAEDVTIHGSGRGSVVTIAKDDVSIRGLNVQRTAPGPVGSPSGIRIEADHVRIADVTVSDAYLGVTVVEAKDVELVSVSVQGRASEAIGDIDHASDDAHGRTGAVGDMGEGRGDGISIVNSKRVILQDVALTDVRDGIYLSFAKDVLVDAAVVSGSRYGIHAMYAQGVDVVDSEIDHNVAGAVLMYGGRMMLLKNVFSNNASSSTGFGILAKDVGGLEAAKNVVTNNRIGIHVEGPSGGTAADQRFVLNTIGFNLIGASLLPSAAATLFGNSFIENETQVATDGGLPSEVEWYKDGAGNYWSDHQALDREGDGISNLEHVYVVGDLRSLDENPALSAIADSPGFRLLDSARKRWMPDRANIVDPFPLMEPHSPSAALPEGATGRGPTLMVSLLMLVLTATLLHRSSRRSASSHRVTIMSRRYADGAA